jgi:predicted TIM-barrel fold metal-dependent hydrolase
MLEAMFDAHLHVVDSATSGRDQTDHPDGAWWEGVDAGPPAIAARLDAAGVSGGVLVQAVGAHGFDNRFVLASAAALGEQWRCVVAVGDHSDDPVGTLVRAVESGATGARLFSIPAPLESWLDDDRGHLIVETCRAIKMTPTICCMPEEVSIAARLVAAYPDVEFAIDHAGFASIGGDEGDLGDLVAQPNLTVKLSTGVFDHSPLEPAAVTRRLLDMVGHERLAWGSDHPQIRDRSYAELATLARSALDGLPSHVQAAVLVETTRRLWFPSS